MTPLLSVRNLHTYYYLPEGIVQAVNGISFKVEQGEIVGLAGESGCGKSTTGLSILKLVPKPGRIVRGKIYFEKKDITALNPEELRKIRWKEISMVFQGAMSSFNPVYKIGDQIVEAITNHSDIEKDEARKQAEKLLEVVGLAGPWFKSYPHELSGGMKQRALLAMALSCTPKLMICDEPTTALDVMVQAQIISLIKELQRRMGLSILLISHDISLMAESCHKIMIMYAGKIVEACGINDFFDTPLHPYSKALVNNVPSIIGRLKKPKVLLGRPPSLIDLPPGCSFHPRCNFATTICLEKNPPLRMIEKHRKVACHLVENWHNVSRD